MYKRPRKKDKGLSSTNRYSLPIIPNRNQVFQLLVIDFPCICKVKQVRNIVFFLKSQVSLFVSKLIKKRMKQGLQRSKSFEWTILKYFFDEIKELLTEIFAFDYLSQIGNYLFPCFGTDLWQFIFLEITFWVHLQHLRICRCSQDLNYLDKLIDVAFGSK